MLMQIINEQGLSLPEALAALLVYCEERQISISFEYDNGRYIDLTVEDGDVQQGPAGWTVLVAGTGYAEEDGTGILYPTIQDAIVAGWGLLERYEFDELSKTEQERTEEEEKGTEEDTAGIP